MSPHLSWHQLIERYSTSWNSARLTILNFASVYIHLGCETSRHRAALTYRSNRSIISLLSSPFLTPGKEEKCAETSIMGLGSGRPRAGPASFVPSAGQFTSYLPRLIIDGDKTPQIKKVFFWENKKKTFTPVSSCNIYPSNRCLPIFFKVRELLLFFCPFRSYLYYCHSYSFMFVSSWCWWSL